MSSEPVDAYRSLMADVYELAGRSRATSESFARRCGQSAARWHVLSVVLEEPRTVPGIADRLGLSRQSVQRVVDDLATAGLVQRAENPRHRRSRLVAITASGEAIAGRLYDESAAARQAHLERAGLSADDLRRAHRIIHRLLAALDEIGDSG